MLGQQIRKLENVKMIPDGNGQFTQEYGNALSEKRQVFWSEIMEICYDCKQWRDRSKCL